MLRSLSALVLLLAIPTAAQTFVVDINNGPGTNFTSIESAIAATPSGAVITVRPGQYFESTFTISATTLSILGEQGVAVILPLGVPLRVEALGPTEQVVLRELDLRSAQPSAIAEIQCTNSQGRVHLESLGTLVDSLSLTATNCDWVVAAGCLFLGGGVRCTNSRVVLEQCEIRRDGLVSFRQAGGHVQLADCTIAGALSYGAGPAATAYLLQGGEVRVSDETVVAGGLLLPSNQRGPCFAGNGTLRIDPGSILSGSTPLIPATISATTTVLPHVTTTSVMLGGTVTAELHGPSGHIGVLGIGFPGPAISFPSLADPVWWLPGTEVTQAIGVPSAMQPLTTFTTIPAAAAFLGSTLVWQGFTFDPSTGLQASNPSVRVAHF